MTIELARCGERLGLIDLGHLYHGSMGTIEPHGMSCPRWELAVAYFYGVTHLVPNTKQDREIRADVTGKIGLLMWLEYQRLGVRDVKNAIFFKANYERLSS